MRKKIIEYTDRWTAGGIEKYIVNLVKGLKTEKWEFYILTAQKENGFFDHELAKYGLTVHSLLSKVYMNPFKRISSTWKLFYQFVKSQRPDIVHIHICQGVGFIYAYLAKCAGVSTVITHSHNSDCGHSHRLIKMTGHLLCRNLFQKSADIRLACSDLAGEWLYGKSKSFRIVNIPIDIERFKFNLEARKRRRLEMGIKEECILLNIGRMGEQKNQLYLIELFYEYQKKHDARLILIGIGEKKKDIKKKINEYQLNEKIIMIDQTTEVEVYMWMADAFVLTSLYEGNPVVLIEAQAAGIPCVYSDTITKLANLNENVTSAPLNGDNEVWITKIEQVLNNPMERAQGYISVKEKGYNPEQIMEEMEKIYIGGQGVI